MTKTVKNIVTGVIVVAVFFAAYKFLIPKAKDSGEDISPDTVQTVDVKPVTFSRAGEAAATLRKVENIKVNTDIFSGQIFKSLKDFRVEVLPEDVGRSNPFAPIN